MIELCTTARGVGGCNHFSVVICVYTKMVIGMYVCVCQGSLSLYSFSSLLYILLQVWRQLREERGREVEGEKEGEREKEREGGRERERSIEEGEGRVGNTDSTSTPIPTLF